MRAFRNLHVRGGGGVLCMWTGRPHRSDVMSSVWWRVPLPRVVATVNEDTLGWGVATYTDSWMRDCLFYLCNNHVLLAVALAHPLHPFSRSRRLMVLANSLSFGFFISGALHMLLTKEGSNSRAARVLVETTAGTLLQLAFDIPAGLLGTCPCAHRALPSLVQQGCTALAAAFLSLHLWCGRVFVLVTVVLIAVVPATSLVEIWTAYLTSKTSAFFWLIPSTVVVYALIRTCEAEVRPNQQSQLPGEML